jgi:hypothetical protein
MNLPFMEDTRSLVRRPAGKSERRWEEYTKRNVREFGCNGVDHFWTPVTVAARFKA